MNHDVPSLEACQRLAKAGLIPLDESGNILWWVELPPDSPFLTRCPASERLDLGVYTYAPTLGEMLAEIRRRGWLGKVRYEPVAQLCDATVGCGPPDVRRRHYEAQHKEAADALANALHEAMEKEGKA